jgi:hypothetical protein
MGRGFHVLRDLTPLRELRDADPGPGASRLHPPAPAVLAAWRAPDRYHGGPAPEYGEPGAVVDWVLAAEPDGPVTVELLSADGHILNGWSSAAAGYAVTASEGMAGQEPVRTGGPRVPRRAGHSRLVIPLEHAGPWREGRGGTGSLEQDGPAVAPGEYRVRVTAGDWSATRPLTVVADPRVAAIGVTDAHLRDQEALALDIRDLLSRARRALDRVEERLDGAIGADRARLEELRDRLTERDDTAYPEPMLVEQIEYLYDMVTETPQQPGRDAFRRYRELLAEMDAVEADT